jgi:SAM-dependent methyltransferase
MTAAFTLSSDEALQAKGPRVPLSYFIEYVLDGETPGRKLCDEGVKALMPFLCGQGTIVELGGVGDYYKKFAPGQRYEVTNLAQPCDRVIDMTRMDYADNSVDAFLSMFALEHIYDYGAVIEESYRCLKPRGRMLLAVPFLYYYHGAPDDYFRFTDSALDRMLNKFDVLRKFSFGNRNLLLCQLFHEKRACGSKHGWLTRTAYRLLSAPRLLGGLLGNQLDRVYAITHLYLCEKPTAESARKAA